MSSIRPNIVLIIPDELRADCLGYMGHPIVQTPIMDRLASEGVTFHRHFANHGKCVPSRATLFTGCYANIGGHRTLGVEIQAGETNMAGHLKEEGYETAMFMRNHTIDESVIDCSFDHWLRVENDKDSDQFRKAPGITDSEEQAFYWGIIDDEDYKSSDKKNTELMCDWLTSRKESDQPFFANINYINPHPPYNAERRLTERFPLDQIEPYSSSHVSPTEPLFMSEIRKYYGGLDETLTDELRRKILQAYYAQILDIDECIGMIERALKDAGLWDNTILIVLSDHGDYAGQYNLVEKWDTGFQDALLHVPVIFSGGALPFDPICIEGLSEHVDIYPTILDMIGLQIPYGLSGISLVPMLEGKAKSLKDEVFAEGGHEQELLEIRIPPEDHYAAIPCYVGKARVRNACPETLRKAKMIRTEEWKYTYRVVEPDELYNMKDDPEELMNLATDPKYVSVKEHLRERLLRHLIENENHQPEDPFPIA